MIWGFGACRKLILMVAGSKKQYIYKPLNLNKYRRIKSVAIFDVIPLWQLVTLGILFIVFLVSCTIIAGVYLSKLRWNIQVLVLKDTPHGSVFYRKDRARLVPFGNGGEKMLFLKKEKAHRASYNKEIGNNMLCFTIGMDGLWYNTTFGSIDKKLMEIGAIPVNQDMRRANSILRKGIDTRYDTKSFMEKWGTAIAMGMLIIAIMIQAGGTYMNHKMSNEGKALDLKNSELQLKILEKQERVLGQVDTIDSGGSGIIPVPLA